MVIHYMQPHAPFVDRPDLGDYGHPSDLLVPAVRRVPWVETTARDAGSHDPTTCRTDSGRSA